MGVCDYRWARESRITKISIYIKLVQGGWIIVWRWTVTARAWCDYSSVAFGNNEKLILIWTYFLPCAVLFIKISFWNVHKKSWKGYNQYDTFSEAYPLLVSLFCCDKSVTFTLRDDPTSSWLRGDCLEISANTIKDLFCISSGWRCGYDGIFSIDGMFWIIEKWVWCSSKSHAWLITAPCVKAKRRVSKRIV